MSHREDAEAERATFDYEHMIELEKQKDKELKSQIKKELIVFLENSNIRSTWDERDEAIEMAHQLRKNNILSEKVINARFNEMIRVATNKKSSSIEKYEVYSQRIKSTVAPEFFEEVLAENTENIESCIEEHLRKIKKSTTIKEERDILELVREIKKASIKNPKKIDELYDEDTKKANEWKKNNLKNLEKYARTIKASKFKDFLELDNTPTDK